MRWVVLRLLSFKKLVLFLNSSSGSWNLTLLNDIVASYRPLLVCQQSMFLLVHSLLDVSCGLATPIYRIQRAPTYPCIARTTIKGRREPGQGRAKPKGDLASTFKGAGSCLKLTFGPGFRAIARCRTSLSVTDPLLPHEDDHDIWAPMSSCQSPAFVQEVPHHAFSPCEQMHIQDIV